MTWSTWSASIPIDPPKSVKGPGARRSGCREPWRQVCDESRSTRADKLLIKPTTDTRPAPPRTPGQIIRRTRNHGQTPEESRAATTAPAWRSIQTDRQALLTDARDADA